MYVNITDMNDVYEKMREREKKVVSDAQIPEYSLFRERESVTRSRNRSV